MSKWTLRLLKLSNATVDPTSNILVVVDYNKGDQPAFTHYDHLDRKELEEAIVYQFIYTREDQVNRAKFIIVKDWESKQLKTINISILDIISKFEAFTGKRLNRVVNETDSTELYFENSKDTDVTQQQPQNLDWLE